MKRTYELTYIVKPDLDSATLERLIERINEYVRADKGEVVKVTRWGTRALSYPIRRYREGHYIFCVVNLEAPAVARLENRLRLQEDVLRYLLVRAEDTGSPAMDFAEPTTAEEPLKPSAVVAEQTPSVEAPAEPPADAESTTASA